MLESPLFVEARSEVNLDGRSVVSWFVSNRVRIHSIDMVIGVIHNYDLRISSLSSWSSSSPDIFWGNLAILRHKVVSKARLIIMVCFPDHSFFLWVNSSVSPVGIIIDIQLSVRVFDQSVSVIDA